ncbi:MAG: pyridoxamine 5'-phosphate oxidase [Scytolyngbya sp. HA4215-MV1]|jgi:pyridoxamine 5'-phosphate oxidase|nr:pyridoxamine 5'-phosphate oxidase [Scytolyngbya sp. HA4215-MV1]
MNSEIAHLRQDYILQTLDETHIDRDPFRQFQTWFDQAVTAQLREPNAMTLATVTPDGLPSARVVLLKGLDEQGFVFYTNYQSHKGQELAATPEAALVFWWADLERQVRVAGSVEKVSAEESDAYFQSRPIGNRLGAWVSNQSQVIPNREVLEQRLHDLTLHYHDQVIPRPSHWGGYRLFPRTIEFWQGRSNRLHDRLLYRRLDAASWQVERLSP